MARVYFVTHPEVKFEWGVAVPEWDLSEKGRARLEVLAGREWVKGVGFWFSSLEKKAVTAVERLAGVSGVAPVFVGALGEIDRSRAGTLSPEEYSVVTEVFFARPEESSRGWERAVDAQRRIVSAVEGIVRGVPKEGVVGIVSHGGVGTLLLCHLKGVGISRGEDQPGQGHYFVFDSEGKVESGWRRIEE